MSHDHPCTYSLLDLFGLDMHTVTHPHTRVHTSVVTVAGGADLNNLLFKKLSHAINTEWPRITQSPNKTGKWMSLIRKKNGS